MWVRTLILGRDLAGLEPAKQRLRRAATMSVVSAMSAEAAIVNIHNLIHIGLVHTAVYHFRHKSH